MSIDIEIPDLVDIEPLEEEGTERLDSSNFVTGEGVFLISEGGERYIDLSSNNDRSPLGYSNFVVDDTPQIFFRCESPVKYGLLDRFYESLKEKFNFDGLLFSFSKEDSRSRVSRLADFWVKSYHNIDEYEILDIANWLGNRQVNLIKKLTNNNNVLLPMGLSVLKTYDLDLSLLKTFITKKTKVIVVDPYFVAHGEFLINSGISDYLGDVVKKSDIILIYDLSNLSIGRDNTEKISQLPIPDITILPDSIGISFPLSVTLINTKLNDLVVKNNIFTSEFSLRGVEAANQYLHYIKEEGFEDKIKENTEYLLNGLKKLEQKHISIVDINHCGFYFIIRTDLSSVSIKNYFLDKKIIVDFLDDKYLLIRPSFSISKVHLDCFLEAFDNCLSELGKFDSLSF